MSQHTEDMVSTRRFTFGKNWRSFLSTMNESRIREAERSLQKMLKLPRLDGLRFLDVGSGSGLFSLAARRLGAIVHSFDYDPESVKCTHLLKNQYFSDDPNWHIEEGSILDRNYLERLGLFDIVYAWGVLHHTGHMWRALANAASRSKPDGILFISIYNDLGIISDRWRMVKRTYCSGVIGKLLILTFFFPYFALPNMLGDFARMKNPLQRYTDYKYKRGMSMVHDWIDWLGGYPYEVAKPEDIFDFMTQRDFTLVRMKTTYSHGCNEFVFRSSESFPNDIVS